MPITYILSQGGSSDALLALNLKRLPEICPEPLEICEAGGRVIGYAISKANRDSLVSLLDPNGELFRSLDVSLDVVPDVMEKLMAIGSALGFEYPEG